MGRTDQINAIAPGAVLTPLLQGGLDDEEFGDAIRTLPVPVGEFGSPEVVAMWIEMMLSDADFGGSVIVVDGGSDALIRPKDWPKPYYSMMQLGGQSVDGVGNYFERLKESVVMENYVSSIHAESQPNKLALVMSDTGETMTYKELHLYAEKVANLLQNAGSKLGTILHYVENRLEFLPICWCPLCRFVLHRYQLSFNCARN